MESPMQSHTSVFVKVKIDVDPNRVEQTSPDILVEVEKIFISKYPMAREPTEIIAIAASPFIFAFWPVLRSSTALTIVIGITIAISSLNPITAAIHIAPNATWESPSPINENLFRTNVTPRSDEQSEINTPTIKAYLTNGYSK